MFHSLKRFWLVLTVLLCGGQSIFAFALLGPFNEAYQVPIIGYHLVPPASAFGNDGGSADIGAPKNFGQGYRWNTPTNYYAYDDTFLEYFGSNGIVAVDQAIAMFNNLSNVSSLNLPDWPYNANRVNYRAKALDLLDLKSYTMSMLIEQLGLAQPDRYTWCLHDRYLPSGAQCPGYEYLIIQRNFDPFTTVYSSYVNGVFYDYYITELCPLTANPYAPLEADAVEFAVDPTQEAQSGTAVAAYGAINLGTYFLSFTQDDIGGLKYLYAATNVFVEAAASNSFQLVTNTLVTELATSNLAIFEQQALTNNPAALTALYPGLVITSTTYSYTNLVTTNVTAYLTNPPYAPAGYVLLVFATNYTTNVQQLYDYTFANLEILHAYSKGFVSQQTVTYGPAGAFAPAGTYQTNTVTSTSLVNFTNGDFYILPTNECAPYQILSTQLVTLTSITNFIPITTNSLITNSTSVLPISESVITYFTNYFYLVHSVDCGTNTVALREGMEHVTFVRVDYDSLLNATVQWGPVTNTYQLTAITNGVPVVQTFQRVLTRPDILFSAADLANGPSAPLNDTGALRSFPSFNTTLVPANQGGPGTIQPTGVQFTYNSVGPIYYNYGPSYGIGDGTVDFSQTNSTFLFQWGSFDGTTNDPVVYPNTTSIASLEAQVFFQITTGLTPGESVSANPSANPYLDGFQLQASGASPPYTWSLSVNSPGLPAGLTLSSAGVISGVPTTPGTYDFTVQATDSGARVAQRDLFVVISP